MRLKPALATLAVAIMFLALAPAIGSAAEQPLVTPNAVVDACVSLASETETGSEGGVQEAKCCKMCRGGTKPCGDTCVKLDKQCRKKSGCACSPLAQEPPDSAI